jgi:hypothetical protein
MALLARSAPGGTRDPSNGSGIRIRGLVACRSTPKVLSVLFHQFIGRSSRGAEGWPPVVAGRTAAGSMSGSSTATSNRTDQRLAQHQT